MVKLSTLVVLGLLFLVAGILIGYGLRSSSPYPGVIGYSILVLSTLYTGERYRQYCQEKPWEEEKRFHSVNHFRHDSGHH